MLHILPPQRLNEKIRAGEALINKAVQAGVAPSLVLQSCTDVQPPSLVEGPAAAPSLSQARPATTDHTRADCPAPMVTDSAGNEGGSNTGDKAAFYRSLKQHWEEAAAGQTDAELKDLQSKMYHALKAQGGEALCSEVMQLLSCTSSKEERRNKMKALLAKNPWNKNLVGLLYVTEIRQNRHIQQQIAANAAAAPARGQVPSVPQSQPAAQPSASGAHPPQALPTGSAGAAVDPAPAGMQQSGTGIVRGGSQSSPLSNPPGGAQSLSSISPSTGAPSSEAPSASAVRADSGHRATNASIQKGHQPAASANASASSGARESSTLVSSDAAGDETDLAMAPNSTQAPATEQVQERTPSAEPAHGRPEAQLDGLESSARGNAFAAEPVDMVIAPSANESKLCPSRAAAAVSGAQPLAGTSPAVTAVASPPQSGDKRAATDPVDSQLQTPSKHQDCGGDTQRATDHGAPSSGDGPDGCDSSAEGDSDDDFCIEIL